MYQDKTLVCKDCGAEFVFTAGEQEFYAARTAAMQERTQASPREKCTQQSAQSAAKKQRFPLSPQATSLFIAANATQQ